MRNILLSGAAGLALAIGFGAGPASAFSGSYTVSFYNGPNHTAAGSFCFVFTSTNNILGFPDSGTWTASQFGGQWTGNYIHDGTALRWYGTYSDAMYAFSNKINARGRVMPGGYDTWSFPNGVLTPSADGTTTFTPGC